MIGPDQMVITLIIDVIVGYFIPIMGGFCLVMIDQQLIVPHYINLVLTLCVWIFISLVLAVILIMLFEYFHGIIMGG